MNSFETVVYQVVTHPRVAEFAQSHRFPGWYFDSNGVYCCCLGKYLISIFFDDEDKDLNITVDGIRDGISSEGWFGKNLEWEWYKEDDDSLANTANRYMAKYATLV